jgi:hypothetical protein
MIQVSKPTAAMPPSITAGGIGAAVMVSQGYVIVKYGIIIHFSSRTI